MGDEGLSGVSVLIRLWEQSGRRLRERCRGLTDEEFFWEPVADCWNIRPDEQHVGGWSYEYEFAPADPAPLTTIGWRLVHLNAGNRLYWNHAFGDATLTFPGLPVPHTAETALSEWRESRIPITAWLADAVRSGRVRWVLAGDSGGFGGNDGRVGSSRVMAAVAEVGRKVTITSGSSTTTLYDLSGRADALAAAGA